MIVTAISVPGHCKFEASSLCIADLIKRLPPWAEGASIKIRSEILFLLFFGLGGLARVGRRRSLGAFDLRAFA